MTTLSTDNGPAFREWEGSVPGSPREMLIRVAEEGVERLVFRPTLACERMSSFGVAVEACDVGIKLGIALASLKLDSSADSFETWLAEAIAAAGLEGYTPKATPAD